MSATVFAIIAEGVSVSYVYYLSYIFEYIKDPSIPSTTGVIYCILYGAAVFTS